MIAGHSVYMAKICLEKNPYLQLSCNTVSTDDVTSQEPRITVVPCAAHSTNQLNHLLHSQDDRAKIKEAEKAKLQLQQMTELKNRASEQIQDLSRQVREAKKVRRHNNNMNPN